MNDDINVRPEPAQAAPAPLRPARRFRLRTVLFPLLFLALHWVAANVVSLVYLLVYVFVQNGLGDPLAILGDQARLEQLLFDQYPVISVFYAAALIPCYLLFLFVQRKRDGRALLLEKPSLNLTLPAVAMMVGALGVTNIWFNLLTFWSDYNSTINTLLEDYIRQAGSFSPTAGYFWLILGISIMAPVAEELLFRGIIQGELRRAMPEWAAILIQGLAFALFHMQPIQISYVLLPGLLLGLAYAWTRSLWVPIIMHIGFNFIGSVLPALVGDDEVLGSIVVISEIAFILVGILAAVYLYMNRRNKPQTVQAADLSGH